MIRQEAVMIKRKNVLLKVLPEAVENAKKINAENFNMAEPLY